MSQDGLVEVQLDELVIQSVRQATAVSLPLVVIKRLEALAASAQAVRASRAELIAMLVSETQLDEEELEARVIAYRRKRVRDVLPHAAHDPATEAVNVIHLAREKPGRPKRTA